MSNSILKKYVILPLRGLSASRSSLASSTAPFLNSLATSVGQEIAISEANINIHVLDSIREDGAKLVEMSEADSKKLRTTHPDILIAPVVYYELATARRLRPRAAPSLLGVQPAATPGIPGQIQVRVIDANSSAGVENALVVAFTDFTNRFGADGRTDSNGNASTLR